MATNQNEEFIQYVLCLVKDYSTNICKTRKDVTHIVSNQIDSIARSVTVEGMKLGLPVYAPQYFNTERSKAVLMLWFLTVTHIVSNQTDSIARAVTVEGMKLGL